jgi:uncharacterized protein YceH (UPF0502 family)
MDLTAEELRVVGCLVEKAMATPDNYPLTVNALVNACNQSSNRDPVVRYDEGTVVAALGRLRERGLVRVVYSPSNRAPKYRHVFDEALGLEPAALAVLCELLVRGAQTAGELRTRGERLHPFSGLDDVEQILDDLSGRDDPLVVRLERRPGQREARHAHLLGGPVEPSGAEPETTAAVPSPITVPGIVATPVDGDDDTGGESSSLESRVAALEREVARLGRLLEDLRPV